MSKPYVHALSSVKKWGGKPEDYLPIHDLMDSSKAVIADVRHRALTHNTWFIFILERIFGTNIVNADGKLVSVRDVGEQHVAEDYGMKFIPSAQDFLENIEMKPWMLRGDGEPPRSAGKIAKMGAAPVFIPFVKD